MLDLVDSIDGVVTPRWFPYWSGPSCKLFIVSTFQISLPPYAKVVKWHKDQLPEDSEPVKDCHWKPVEAVIDDWPDDESPDLIFQPLWPFNAWLPDIVIHPVGEIVGPVAIFGFILPPPVWDENVCPGESWEIHNYIMAPPYNWIHNIPHYFHDELPDAPEESECQFLDESWDIENPHSPAP